jgi:HK97 family phage portal protein
MNYTRPATEREAQGLPPFGRAVNLLSNAIASTDWFAQKPDLATGLMVRLADQPEILTNPDPLTTVWHYRWATAWDGILYGNHFALPGDIDWRTGRPGWLVPIAADQVWLATDPGSPGWYEWVIGGVTFDAADIFHIPFGNRSGQILGLGVLAQYGDWLAGAVAAEDYSRDQFSSGSLPAAVITSNQVATQEQADDLKLKWREITRTREPVIFPNGTVITPVVGNAEQAQLVEARTYNAQMIADLVGIPGSKLGLACPTMTYSNIETEDLDFVRDSVDRYARPITESISKWMLPGGTEVVWDYPSRMRADTTSTANVLTTYVASKIMTVNEARSRLNLPPLEDGDAVVPPTPPDTTGNELDAQAAQEAIGAQVPQISNGVQL